MERFQLIHIKSGIIALALSNEKMKEHIKHIDHYWHQYSVEKWVGTERQFSLPLISYVQHYLL